MAALKSVLLLSVIVFGHTETASGSYSEDVDDMFKSLENHLSGSSVCVSEAKQKMGRSSFTELDDKYAVAIIHLYTNQCPLPTAFYKKLNYEMRHGNPSGIWKTAGDLINQGLDILGLEYYKLVYRGCSEFADDPKVGDTDFRFNQIISTSKSESVALGFSGNCGILFKIENVNGLPVKNYSKFPDENEIMLKSTNKFKVLDDTGDSKKIRLITLDGQPSVNKGFKALPETYLLLSFVIQIILII